MGSDDSLHLELAAWRLRFETGMGSAKWDPACLLTASLVGLPVFQSHHAESDVCHAVEEHQALPHLVNIVIYCMTGSNPQRKSVCKTEGEHTHITNKCILWYRGVATIKNTAVVTLVLFMGI